MMNTTPGDTPPSSDDERFELAAMSARSIIRRSGAHVRLATRQLEHLTDVAAPSTPFGKDIAAAKDGAHTIAFNQSVRYVEALSNAMVSHLGGLNVLTQHDTFHALPTTVIARSIAEAAVATAWMVDPTATPDLRAARGYAMLFRVIEDGIKQSLPADASANTKMREDLVEQLRGSNVVVKRRERDGRVHDEIGQVSIGDAHVKTSFNITQRMGAVSPTLGKLYPGMSSTAHSEPLHLSNAWEQADGYARRLGIVVHESVAVWSAAIHGWVGAEPGHVKNEDDITRIMQSIHPEALAAIRERRAGTTSADATAGLGGSA